MWNNSSPDFFKFLYLAVCCFIQSSLCLTVTSGGVRITSWKLKCRTYKAVYSRWTTPEGLWNGDHSDVKLVHVLCSETFLCLNDVAIDSNGNSYEVWGPFLKYFSSFRTQNPKFSATQQDFYDVKNLSLQWKKYAPCSTIWSFCRK